MAAVVTAFRPTKQIAAQELLPRSTVAIHRKHAIAELPGFQASYADSVEVKQDIPLDEKCPVCAKNLAIKHGRFGEYTACSDYPNCKYIKLKTTGVGCPKACGGEIVKRKSKRGKTFYGCSNYPDCDFALWDKPIAEPCPQCNPGYTLVKTTKRSGTVRFCNDKECGFKEAMNTEG